MFFIIVLPCLLVALNFGVDKLQLDIDYPNLVLNVNQWYSPNVYQVPYAYFKGGVSQNELYKSGWNNTYQKSLQQTWGSLVDYDVNISSASSKNMTQLEWKKQLFNHRDDHISFHYTSVYFDPYDTNQVSAGFNLSAEHSFPTAMSMIDNWALQQLLPSVGTSITTSTHPLPSTKFSTSLCGQYFWFDCCDHINDRNDLCASWNRIPIGSGKNTANKTSTTATGVWSVHCQLLVWTIYVRFPCVTAHMCIDYNDGSRV
jgi:hypothetical protein